MGIVSFTDNQRLPVGSPYGGPSRILTSDRYNSAVCLETGDRKIFKFSVKKGDSCAEDRASPNYQDDPTQNPNPIKKMPNRSMQAFEDRPNWLPYNKLITIERSINIEPGPVSTHQIFFVLDQLNQRPTGSNPWRSPCFATALKPQQEAILIDVHTAPNTSSASQAIRVGEFALPSRTRLDMKTEIIVSGGQSGGYLKTTINGQNVHPEYNGPIGFDGMEGPYYGRGAYRDPWGVGELVTVHHENLKITVAP